jgi:MFS family permease
MGIVDRWVQTVRSEIEILPKVDQVDVERPDVQQETEEITEKGSRWTIFATGAGLFSDGYINNSIGVVGTLLSIIYGTEYKDSSALSNVASIAFVGIVVGQLSFGYLVDRWSRKAGMLIAMSILILFTILCSGAYGYRGSPEGLFAAITAYRFFLGIGLGAEYPSGSVAASEASQSLARGKRHRWVAWTTNTMIDFGFVVSSFVPLVLLWICGEDHLGTVWRLTIGLGAIPPMSLFYLRLKFKEPAAFRKNNMKHTRIPYGLVLKYYWPRLLSISFIWCVYDFSAYAFGIYSSTVLDIILGEESPLWKTLGWNVVINLFLMPGAILGAWWSDYFGPRITLCTGIFIQAIFGYAMAGSLETLQKNVAGFVVVFGFFYALGEFGPGNNTIIIASKSTAACVRGQFYGVAAACGKIGAYIGTKSFPYLIARYGGDNSVKGLQAPFWVACSLSCVSGLVCLFFTPALTQDAIALEEVNFRGYLEENGFDLSKLGDAKEIDSASSNNEGSFKEMITVGETEMSS